jgi:tyrosyl-tRNA synthetase
MSTFLDELKWRGFLEATTSDDMGAFLDAKRRTIYIGFDPTADSLHLGSLIQVMVLAHAQRHGHRPLVLVGGGTGLIGDPSGRADERTLLTAEETAANVAGIRAQLSRFFDLSSPDKGLLLNNADWLVPLNLVEFLRDIGKHFSVNEMIKRDSVRIRLEERDHGITYTEFSYMLLQAYDFFHLCKHYDCEIQMGGSDQWGNILSGKELIRRILGRQGEGITTPLLMNSDGKKFGKSVAGAVWLDAKRTSPYQMYQYWLQTTDQDAARYLKLFTFLDAARIAQLEETVRTKPELREAQRVLAAECTAIVHGRKAVESVEAASGMLFGEWNASPSNDVLEVLTSEVPVTEITRAELDAPISLLDVLVKAKVVESKGAGRKLIGGGGLYLNNVRQTDEKKMLSSTDLLWPNAALIRSGKKNYYLLLIR